MRQFSGAPLADKEPRPPVMLPPPADARRAGQDELETEERRAAAQIEAEDQRAQEERLQTYLEQMGTLLIDEGLLDSEEDDEARYLARARTLAVFRRADPSQKRSVVEFLAESGLAGSGVPGNYVEPVISLADANFAGADLAILDYLRGADLTEARLSDAILVRIDLDEASLARAKLDGADLTDAHLPRGPDGRRAVER